MTTTTLMEQAAASAPADNDTPCPRCGGLMVPDRFIDLLDDTGHLEFVAARCVSCGEVVDPVIIENRHRGPQPKRVTLKRQRAIPAPARPAAAPLEDGTVVAIAPETPAVVDEPAVH